MLAVHRWIKVVTFFWIRLQHAGETPVQRSVYEDRTRNRQQNCISDGTETREW